MKPNVCLCGYVGYKDIQITTDWGYEWFRVCFKCGTLRQVVDFKDLDDQHDQSPEREKEKL